MRAKPEYRDRPQTEVAVLDALADRPEDGMTIFELRSRVDVSIDSLEDALSALKTDDLIEVDSNGDRTVLTPQENVVGPYDPDESESILDEIKRRFF
jgi:predicted transcriptional regulator